jgi:hypothetical protein
MRASANNTAASRTGLRAIITPWGFRHLRFVAGIRFAAAIFLLIIGLHMASIGQPGWAAFLLFFSAVHVVWGSWQVSIAR